MAGRMRVQSIPISFSFLIFVVVTLHGQQSVPSISVTGSVTTPLMLTAESLADKANGKALFVENGAFRIVVPRDKRGARSVRMLTKIEVVQVRK
jgi:hypothetical protein